MLPKHIRKTFYDLVMGDLPLDSFEQWLYESHEEIEHLINPNDYLDLISFNFRKKYAAHDLNRLIEKYVDFAEFDSLRLLGILHKAKDRNTPKLHLVITELYDLYCGGYYFLRTLGLMYGLVVASPYPTYDWDKLTETEQNKLLDKLYPEIIDEIESVIMLLESKTIVVLGKKEDGYLDFHDERGISGYPLPSETI